ncbi:MarR family winged helix-turn-helix transcriptional regulator [Winogradskyella luteola]|uniref:MarR family transcriptional regulator n=1 Tax=Winogradskyella luteola TaxID=2828330 RepID=A0A9X1F7M2_9FLAO|nr:MarR family transcriptional regulator [Winogradskyella luteola]MBV7267948.1 MarR family transcriptional regulator [Winogradskyella luteola]
MFKLPNEVIFYTIERSIKEYRHFAQKQLWKAFPDITVDQALIFTLISSNPEMTQEELSDVLFKEKASVTRMIELLRKNGYLNREIHETDRRRFKLTPSKKGKAALDKIIEIIKQNRTIALEGINQYDQTHLNETLNKLIKNCTK